jgi:hypothetical protein
MQRCDFVRLKKDVLRLTFALVVLPMSCFAQSNPSYAPPPPNPKPLSFPSPKCVPKCQGKFCGADGCGGVCGACGPREICKGVPVPYGRSIYSCAHEPNPKCSSSDWIKACRDWNLVVAASATCFMAISTCFGLAGGPQAGPACLPIAAAVGCTMSVAELQYAADALQKCTDHHIMCSSSRNSSKPGTCDARGTPGITLPGAFCANCCLRVHPYDRDHKLDIIPGPSDAQRRACNKLCLQRAATVNQPTSASDPIP